VDRDHFIQCPCCKAWFSSHDILDSPQVEPLGMTFDGGDTQFNLLYFNHVDPRCGSTFTIEARRLASFLAEEVPPEVMAGTAACEHHCSSMDDLSDCRTECCWAPYRRFLLYLRARRDLPTRQPSSRD
jgi:hypothetical protein